MDPNDPFADLVPGGASQAPSGPIGYIPGTPKPIQPPSGFEPDPAKPGGLRPIPGGPADKPGGKEPKQIPATAASGIQSNLSSLRNVDAAIASLKARPQSIGPGTGALGDTFTQFNDPGGTDTRALVGKIGATTIHDLSGAAVSATEAPRFQPFVPTPQDRPEVALHKLQQFRDNLQAQVKESLDYYGPNNGYLPYKTPQADEFLKSGSTAETVGGFGLHQDKHTKDMSPEQAAAYDAFWKANPNPSPEQLKTFGQSINVPITNADAIIKAKQQGHGISHTMDSTDPRVREMVRQRMQQGGSAGAAGVVGAEDALTIGSADELGGALDALGGSLQGKGSFSDLYNLNTDANRGYEQALQSAHPIAYGAGQVGGSLLLPTFGASGAAGLAKLGAGYGAAYGFNSGQDSLGSRLGGAAEGGVAGAAAGYAVPKTLSAIFAQKAAREIPSLVDTATGALNQPLEAMRPGQRVQAANQFGIDLPLDAAGGASAAKIGKGLDYLPASAGVMEDARRATEQQVAHAANDVAGQYGSSRTLNEAGSELQRGASERIERGKGVISKAYNAIPISDAAPASNTSAVATLQQLTGRFQSNPELADAVRDPRLLTYLNALQSGGLSWRDLKDFRSLVGEKIGDVRFGEGHSTQDLRALYGALSEDMRSTAAQQGPRAVRAFERANNLNRENQNLIEGALTRILGKGGELAPEKAAAAVQAMTNGGKASGDLKTLAQIRSATAKSGAWDEIAATLIRLGGQPAKSAGRDFNPGTFVNWYADMAQPARNLLFGTGELRKALDGFTAVNQRLMKVNALRNTSQTTPGIMAGTTVAALSANGGVAMMGHPGAAFGMLALEGAGAAVNFGMAKVWTNPAFVRWATGFAKASSPGAAKSQIGRLSKLAATNPEIREPLISLQQHLLHASNDNSMSSAVASQTNSEEQ